MSSRAKRQPSGAQPSRPTAQQDKPTQVVAQNWTGPLPPPGALAQFGEIIPDGAERILRMAELEQAHRLETERAVTEANIQSANEALRQSRIGLNSGAAVSALSIVGTVVSIWLNAHPTVSIALVSVPVLGMVKALIDGKTDK